MQTISISNLKSHLSAELKRVQAGEALLVVDHQRPVAILSPLPATEPALKKASVPYDCRDLEPLTGRDPLEYLTQDRLDRW